MVGMLELAARFPWSPTVRRTLNGVYRSPRDRPGAPGLRHPQRRHPHADARCVPGGSSRIPAGPAIVIAYTVPFFFGWLLYRNRDLLDSFRRHAWKQTILALACSPRG